jgi:hypothetical protein
MDTKQNSKKTSSAYNTAFAAGLRDGLAWDLDGFNSRSEVAAATDWAGSSISAVGWVAWLKSCGLPLGLTFRSVRSNRIVAAYDRGCRKGVLANQTTRTGCGPSCQ